MSTEFERGRDYGQRFMKRVVELLGGRDKAIAQMKSEHEDLKARWQQQDAQLIGRILRAHLYVEHYMTEHLEKSNPRLGSIADARLGFAQKLELLNTQVPGVAELLPGIRRLNSIRNRLAHRMSATVTAEDASVFIAAKVFNATRTMASEPGKPSDEPIAVLESFAEYSAMMLAGEFSATGMAMQQAANELASEAEDL